MNLYTVNKSKDQFIIYHKHLEDILNFICYKTKKAIELTMTFSN